MDISFYALLTVACLVLVLAMWVCAAQGTPKWGPDLTLELPPHLLQEALFPSTTPAGSTNNTIPVRICLVEAHRLTWTPLGTNGRVRKIFTAAIGSSILETNRHGIGCPSKNHLQHVVGLLAASENGCQNYISLIGDFHFGDEMFSWQDIRVFLAFLGEVAVRSLREQRVLVIDAIVLNSALYLRDHLQNRIEQLGGWSAFHIDCLRCVLHQSLSKICRLFYEHPVPSAPSELPCDPLLRNEHSMGMSSPPPLPPKPPVRRAPPPPVLVHIDQHAVQVLPSQYVPRKKLRPVFSTFTAEEPA